MILARINNSKVETIAVILIALLPILNYLGRGLFYWDCLLIFLISIYIVYKKSSFKKLLIEYKTPIIILTVYCIFLISSYFNPTIKYSKVFSMLFMLTVLIYPLYYYFVLSNNKNSNMNLYFNLLFNSIFFVSLFLCISYIIDINILDLKFNQFNHSLFHSKQSFLAICMGFLLYYVHANYSKINLLFFIIIVLGMFASHGKTAIFTMILGIVAYYLSYMILSKKITFFKILFILLGVFISLYITIVVRGDNISNFDMNSFTSGRFDGWLIYIQTVINDNTIFGYGILGGKELYAQGILSFKHPHNIFVESLFTTGLIGFIAIVILWIFYTYKVFFNKLENKLKSLVIATYITTLVSAQGFWSIWAENHIIPISMVVFISLLLIDNFEKNTN